LKRYKENISSQEKLPKYSVLSLYEAWIRWWWRKRRKGRAYLLVDVIGGGRARGPYSRLLLILSFWCIRSVLLQSLRV